MTMLSSLSKCKVSRMAYFSPSIITNNFAMPKQTVVLTSVREVAARKVYGHEEGHGNKNEVRKEKWIRKRMRRSLGGDYREYQLGESRSLISVGNPIIDNLDWSYADGRPGVPSFRQIQQIILQKEYASEIKNALDLVKQFEQTNINAANKEEEYIKQKQTLKAKGEKIL